MITSEWVERLDDEVSARLEANEHAQQILEDVLDTLKAMVELEEK